MTDSACNEGPDALADTPVPPDRARPSREQLGALCWRIRRGRPEVLLITSRDTRRWIIPKGWPIAGIEPPLSALREAWEEAGVRGNVAPDPIGEYGYVKAMRGAPGVPCTVVVDPVRVGSLASAVPERHERRRRWFSAAKAARKVAEPELRGLIEAFGEMVSPRGKSAMGSAGATTGMVARDRAAVPA